jgi:four helix bundle suffix protein
MSEPIILPHGGYKNLITYQKSDFIFQGTCIFVKRFLKAGDRTIDQMVQAARSGKQNIIEGSQASATSKEIELNLTNVAKASLEELLEDYLDYLKIRNLSEWSKDSETGLVARQVGRESVWDKFRPYIEQESNEVAANFMISAIRQCTYLLSRQIAYLEDDFKKHGGIKERMYTARREARGDDWSKAAYSYLAKVNTSAELEIRLSEMISELRQMTGHLKKRNGWE